MLGELLAMVRGDDDQDVVEQAASPKPIAELMLPPPVAPTVM
jgi:hypothetical protein